MKRRYALLSSGLLAMVVLFFLIDSAWLASFGGDVSGDRVVRAGSSKMYHDGRFENIPPVPMIAAGGYIPMLRRTLFGNDTRIPPGPIPLMRLNRVDFTSPPAPGLRAIWFGHASVLVEIDGLRIFTDPVFSGKVSPFQDIGPVRFFNPPMALVDLPPIDAVVISHDHYDHLDMKTIKFLASRGTVFFVPLGIGAHLEKWGVRPQKIVELDWWQSGHIGSVEFVCTPAVHYSGRGPLSRNSTLWSSWVVVGPHHRFFHSGDSGFSGHFQEIGNRFGPLDLTLIKIGAYDWTWEGIHMNPEKAVAAHQALRGRRMLPIHWGTFNLAIHAWDEPIRRAQDEAIKEKVDLVTPVPGQIMDADKPFISKMWWEDVR